ncbi:MAG: GTP-binding protein [Chloroflexi bacterium]|nr:GTP-binding protein [Chloroflexota bacterium]
MSSTPSMSANTPIPVTILAGFLGSGKTTLLNRILHAEHGLRVAVLINDFGEVNIDLKLADGDQASDMISLPNGCICCTLFGNLVEVLRNLTELAEAPDHILIEASGVSQPHQIADILAVTDLKPHLRLDGIITLVDSENVQRLAEVVMFIEKQLSDADLIVLNKIDLIEAEALEELQTWIRGIAPDARILPTTYAEVPLALLLSIGHGDPSLAFDLHDEHIHHHDHDHEHEHGGDHGLMFETWLYQADHALERSALLQAVAQLPATIYRGKGIVCLSDSPDQRTILQMVGRRLRLDTAGGWGDLSPHTELVFIGAPAALDEAVQASFKSLLQFDPVNLG